MNTRVYTLHIYLLYETILQIANRLQARIVSFMQKRANPVRSFGTKKRRMNRRVRKQTGLYANTFFRLNAVYRSAAEANLALVEYDPLPGRYRALRPVERNMRA